MATQKFINLGSFEQRNRGASFKNSYNYERLFDTMLYEKWIQNPSISTMKNKCTEIHV